MPEHLVLLDLHEKQAMLIFGPWYADFLLECDAVPVVAVVERDGAAEALLVAPFMAIVVEACVALSLEGVFVPEEVDFGDFLVLICLAVDGARGEAAASKSTSTREKAPVIR